MTPAEHGQERWTITKFSFRENVVGPEVQGVEVVPAADNRALEESAAEFEAKFEQAAAETETLEAERRALVEALWEIRAAAEAALDRIQEGR